MPEGSGVNFVIPGASWNLRFDASALSVLQGKAQRSGRTKESVGQLFSNDLAASSIVISRASVLQPRRASWSSVSFDPDEAMRQRRLCLQSGLHCVGLWHTHPEGAPYPSSIDEHLAADQAGAASPVLNALAFVIVGTQPFPAGWYVGFHDGKRFHRATLITEEPLGASSD